MTTKIIIILLILFSVPFLFSKLETTRVEQPIEQQTENTEKEVKNASNYEEESNQVQVKQLENATLQNNTITDENNSDTSKESCKTDCSVEVPVCDDESCNNDNIDTCIDAACEGDNVDDPSVCPDNSCIVHLPICYVDNCFDDIEQKEEIHIPNDVDQCIELFYDIELATESEVEFESENDILTTYRGLCNELINFKPNTYEEFINNRPESFPPMPLKVEQLGKYLFDSYEVLYEKNI